jgi:capsular exopolysaccharide synthesis family protein
MSREYKSFSRIKNPSYEQNLIIDQNESDVSDELICLDTVEVVESKLTAESRLVVIQKPRSLAADQFRLLRLRLRELGASGRLKTLLITSTLPGEGKTTTALNLAVSLSENGRHKVVIVEGDLRKPSLVQQLGLKPWPALVKCLQGEIRLALSIRRIDPLNVYLLPSGESAINPTELIGSEKFSKIIDEVRAVADWVIIDAPPSNPIPDVLALRKKADKCLWVLRAGVTPREMAEEAIRHLGREFVVGMVLNRVEELEANYSQYYDYYYRRQSK